MSSNPEGSPRTSAPRGVKSVATPVDKSAPPRKQHRPSSPLVSSSSSSSSPSSSPPSSASPPVTASPKNAKNKKDTTEPSLAHQKAKDFVVAMSSLPHFDKRASSSPSSSSSAASPAASSSPPSPVPARKGKGDDQEGGQSPIPTREEVLDALERYYLFRVRYHESLIEASKTRFFNFELDHLSHARKRLSSYISQFSPSPSSSVLTANPTVITPSISLEDDDESEEDDALDADEPLGRSDLPPGAKQTEETDPKIGEKRAREKRKMEYIRSETEVNHSLTRTRSGIVICPYATWALINHNIWTKEDPVLRYVPYFSDSFTETTNWYTDFKNLFEKGLWEMPTEDPILYSALLDCCLSLREFILSNFPDSPMCPSDAAPASNNETNTPDKAIDTRPSSPFDRSSVSSDVKMPVAKQKRTKKSKSNPSKQKPLKTTQSQSSSSSSSSSSSDSETQRPSPSPSPLASSVFKAVDFDSSSATGTKDGAESKENSRQLPITFQEAVEWLVEQYEELSHLNTDTLQDLMDNLSFEFLRLYSYRLPDLFPNSSGGGNNSSSKNSADTKTYPRNSPNLFLEDNSTKSPLKKTQSSPAKPKNPKDAQGLSRTTSPTTETKGYFTVADEQVDYVCRSVAESTESFRVLFCRRCLVFECPLHGVSSAAGPKCHVTLFEDSCKNSSRVIELNGLEFLPKYIFPPSSTSSSSSSSSSGSEEVGRVLMVDDFMSDEVEWSPKEIELLHMAIRIFGPLTSQVSLMIPTKTEDQVEKRLRHLYPVMPIPVLDPSETPEDPSDSGCVSPSSSQGSTPRSSSSSSIIDASPPPQAHPGRPKKKASLKKKPVESINNQGRIRQAIITARSFAIQERDSNVPGEHWHFPCNHDGPCDSSTGCSCISNYNMCEPLCGCSEECAIRWCGCRCKGGCKTNSCPCYASNRECDPVLCKGCGATKTPDAQDADLRSCQNVNLLYGLQKRVFVNTSSIAGIGAFVGEPIEKGQFIHEYMGEIITQEDADRRGTIYDTKKHSYLFNLSKNYAIDATQMGNKSRFINHSSNPNCFPKLMKVRGDLRIGLYSSRAIATGEELFFDYNYPPEIEKELGLKQVFSHRQLSSMRT